MNKTDIKLWVEYKKSIEKQNAVLVRSWKESTKLQKAIYDQEWAMYKAKLAIRDAKIADYEKEVQEYESLPFLERFFTTQPEPLMYWDYRYPYMPQFRLIGLPATIDATQEGFMDWLAKRLND